MIEDEPTRWRHDGGPVAILGGLIAATVVALLVALLVARLFGWLHLGFRPRDGGLPHWLRWVGPVLGVGKLVFLVGLGVLACSGSVNCRQDRPVRSLPVDIRDRATW